MRVDYAHNSGALEQNRELFGWPSADPKDCTCFVRSPLPSSPSSSHTLWRASADTGLDGAALEAVRKQFEPRTVSFVIAVHNGQNFLADKLGSILALDYPRELMEIVVVSDASTDATDEIARSFSGEGVKLIRVPRGGKPAALNIAVPETSGEILILTDVRQTLERDDVRRMIACFGDPTGAGVVSGDLVVRTGNVKKPMWACTGGMSDGNRKQLKHMGFDDGSDRPLSTASDGPSFAPSRRTCYSTICMCLRSASSRVTG